MFNLFEHIGAVKVSIVEKLDSPDGHRTALFYSVSSGAFGTSYFVTLSRPNEEVRHADRKYFLGLVKPRLIDMNWRDSNHLGIEIRATSATETLQGRKVIVLDGVMIEVLGEPGDFDNVIIMN